MNIETKKLIKQINGYLDGNPADALVALYYISVHYHGGQDDPLYAVAHLTGFNPGHTSFDSEVSEESSMLCVYEEMEYSAKHRRNEIDWITMTKYYNRAYRQMEY